MARSYGRQATRKARERYNFGFGKIDISNDKRNVHKKNFTKFGSPENNNNCGAEVQQVKALLFKHE